MADPIERDDSIVTNRLMVDSADDHDGPRRLGTDAEAVDHLGNGGAVAGIACRLDPLPNLAERGDIKT